MFATWSACLVGAADMWTVAVVVVVVIVVMTAAVVNAVSMRALAVVAAARCNAQPSIAVGQSTYIRTRT